MKRRLFGIDLIKAVAIILIILIHLSQIIDIPMLSPIFNYIIFIGVGLFVFASGFLLYSYNPNVEGWQGIRSFFKKRIVRIFPLYWVALMFAFIVTPVLFYQKSSIYIYLTGTQIFTGKFLELNVFWFVGLILVYYALYPFLANYARRPMMLGVVAIALMTPFAVISYMTGLIDIRFFIYFPMFISGILVSCFREYLVFFNSKIGSTALIICFISSSLVLPLFEYGSKIGLPSPIRFAIFVALIAMITLSAGLILYLVGERLENDSIVTRSIVNISQSSYAIYLVHVTILLLVSQILNAIGVDGALFYLTMIVTAMSCVGVGYSINLASLLFKNAVTRKRFIRTMVVNRELPFKGHGES